jgi:hypothetical protein
MASDSRTQTSGSEWLDFLNFPSAKVFPFTAQSLCET